MSKYHDGEDILEYLRNMSYGQSPLFEGYKHFKLLKSKELLIPNFTSLRLMWNSGCTDEHFNLTEDFKLEGILLNAHSGRPGIHEPELILKIKDDFNDGYVPFEVSNLDFDILFPED